MIDFLLGLSVCLSVCLSMEIDCFGLRRGLLVKKLFCSLFNPVISLYIYYDQYEQIWKKKFPRLVSMEMAATFDFRALTKVHITSKPLLEMQ